MGCRKACSSTLLMVILAIVFVLTINQLPVAHARHVRSPSMSTGEHSSVDQKGSRGTSNNDHGVEHTKNTETVSVEKGSTAEGASGASFSRSGGSTSPAASDEKVVVVARYGPRPHPKKHN
ncbi:hypothetical protein HU200_038996 [Digitaria exilis]|uniref:Uncharacterized protein n=1 Tax=Digitaria exilis TaxID=1010633 RepID=A0A835BD67_9POAL|nr:hypothetical protein HU200_038996 [Digitaria exilis]